MGYIAWNFKYFCSLKVQWLKMIAEKSVQGVSLSANSTYWIEICALIKQGDVQEVLVQIYKKKPFNENSKLFISQRYKHIDIVNTSLVYIK